VPLDYSRAVFIRREFTVDCSPDAAWDAMRDVGNVHTRLVRGFVTDCTLADGVRTVTFANGITAQERIVSLDDDLRRLAYSATGGRTSHHHATVEVRGDGEQATLVWSVDLLPDEMGPAIAAMMDAGVAAMVATLGGDATSI